MIDYDGIAPGVTFTESEEEDTSLADVSTAIGIVGVATKGPLEPTLISSVAQLHRVFGEAPSIDSAIKGAEVCLAYNPEIYFQRIVSNTAASAIGTGSTFKFTTLYQTSVYNGYKVTLVYDEDSDEIIYSLYDTEGNVLETFECDTDSASDDSVQNIINKYSDYLTCERVSQTGDTIAVSDVEKQSTTTYSDTEVYPIEITISNGDSGLTWKETVGTDGEVTATASQNEIAAVIAGINAFKDPEKIDFATLIVPNYTDTAVYQAVEAVIEYRKDIFYIPSIPKGMTPNEMANFVRKAGLNGYKFNSSFVGWFYPNGKVYDSTTGLDVVVDIAPYVAATYARSDAQSKIWYAAAGIVRGLVPCLSGLEYNTNKEERDMLYDSKVNVNSITNVRGVGIAIMGARTSRIYKTTATNKSLRYIPVRRLCNYIRKVVLRDSLYNLFDPNDTYTWNDWILRIEPLLREIKQSRGIYDYQVKMDATTTSSEDISNGIANGVIKIAPEKPTEYINVSFVVAKDGITSFEETEE